MRRGARQGIEGILSRHHGPLNLGHDVLRLDRLHGTGASDRLKLCVCSTTKKPWRRRYRCTDLHITTRWATVWTVYYLANRISLE